MAGITSDWLERLPPFVSAAQVAEIFDTTRQGALRWMGGPDSPLPRAKRPDNQIVTAREFVVRLALAMYGEMGQDVRVAGFRDQGSELGDGPEGGAARGDGVDRPRDNGTSFY